MAAAAKSSGQYEVASGDNLWNISGKSDIYGDPYQWPLIYKANQDRIKDADLIYPGQVFDIDQNASSSDVSAAIQHARTRGAWSLGAVEESDKAYLAQ
ncbi:MAG: LysM peptidoglycan-binding domain-containing protein [Pseudomonadota bacterium]|nr:MAG: LysM peptidoglycan-binding domain-containing protein [Pseudomonadota bacterium]